MRQVSTSTDYVNQEEDERLDYFQSLIHDIALGGRLFTVPLKVRNHRLRILDVGHGTGIWTYEMADSEEWKQHVDVVGIDLHSRTPPREQGNPSNASFRTPVDFLKPNWPFPRDSHDFIRMSQLCGSVPDWWSLYRNVTRSVSICAY